MRQGAQGWCTGKTQRGSGWGTNAHPWLIHVKVWQKPLQYCNLSPIKINKFKKRIKKKNLSELWMCLSNKYLSPFIFKSKG